METLVKELQESRVNLDLLITKVKTLQPSRGTALSITALEKGRMYIGELALMYGADNKYDHSKVKEAKDIPEATDKHKNQIETKPKDDITSILSIRGEIELELNIINKLIGGVSQEQSPFNKFKRDCYISEAFRSIVEGRMYLGVRLGELRDNEKK
jgi:hypothetical protein